LNWKVLRLSLRCFWRRSDVNAVAASNQQYRRNQNLFHGIVRRENGNVPLPFYSDSSSTLASISAESFWAEIRLAQQPATVARNSTVVGQSPDAQASASRFNPPPGTCPAESRRRSNRLHGAASFNPPPGTCPAESFVHDLKQGGWVSSQ
jgi:hypothetical protein